MIDQLLAGHYRILQVLGTGGFGQTYIAEDTHRPGNPKCVVKHLKPASSATQVLGIARTLFKKEAETLERLGSYEHIPRLLAYFEENKEFYLVQEFIDGYPLSRELPPGKKWSDTQIIEMLIEILGILKFIHTQGVIHRDIKPDNIIRKVSDRKLVLIDFGAIKQVRQTVIATGQQSLTVAIGTPGYMPTEQSRGTPRPNSDIYALGMIGIQASTGVYPSKLHELYEDPNTGELLWQSQATVSPELAAVLTKMTQYHFKDRYQTASEVLQAIEQLSHPYTATVQATTISHARQELTLEWVEAGLIKSRTILENQPSKNSGTVRIGRDPQACDIVLSDPTVSGLHVEIFFDSQQQRFRVRNLRLSNPPLVNGQLLPTGEVALDPNSSLRLGQLDLRVASISLKHYSTSGGYNPTVYPTQPPSQPPQPIPKTVQPPSASNPGQQISVTPSNPSIVRTRANKLPLLIGLGVAAVVSGGGFAYIILISSPAPNTSRVRVTPSTPAKSPEAIAPDKPNVAKPSQPTVTPSRQDEVKPSQPSVTPVIINNQTTPQQQSVTQPHKERSQQQSVTPPHKERSQQQSDKQPDQEPQQQSVTPPAQERSQQQSVTPPHKERSQQQSVTPPAQERSQQQTTDPSSPSNQSNSNSNSSPKPTENPIQNKPPDNEGINILAEARVLAIEGNLAAAISKAEQVPVDSSAYQDAQDEKALWQQQLESQNSEPSPTPTQTPSQSPETLPTPTQTPSQSPETLPTPTQTPSQSPETLPTPTQTPSQSPETLPTPTQTP